MVIQLTKLGRNMHAYVILVPGLQPKGALRRVFLATSQCIFSWFKDGAPIPPDLQIEEKSLNEVLAADVLGAVGAAQRRVHVSRGQPRRRRQLHRAARRQRHLNRQSTGLARMRVRSPLSLGDEPVSHRRSTRHLCPTYLESPLRLNSKLCSNKNTLLRCRTFIMLNTKLQNTPN
ncbi:hypothetical protein ACJJTC_015067 [Scirpophaga incertulas]